MVVRIRMKAINPGAMKTEQYAREVFAGFLAERFQLEKLQRKITRTWSSRPDFDTKYKNNLLSTSMVYSTDDVRFVNLDRGTNKRWAIMSKPFTAKSRVRKIGAWGGRGGAVVRGRRNMVAPRPGIKARYFTEEMSKRRQKPFTTNMRRAMARGARGAF